MKETCGVRSDIFLITVLCALAFWVALVPINSDDFWWHLKAGEQILNSGSIPAEDLYTYTAGHDDPDYPGRVRFILTQYWLSQVIYALVVKYAGFKGILALRGALFLALMLLVAVLVRLQSGRVRLPALALFVLTTKVAVEDSDRPHLFIFLFAFLVIFLIERAVAKDEQRSIFVLVPATVIASNMHGGFVIGVGFIGVYFVCSFFEGRLKPFRKPLLALLIMSFISSYLNPNHWQAYIGSLASFSSMPAIATIMEFGSPFSILQHVFRQPSWISYWALTVLSIPAAVSCFRNGKYSQALLLAATGAAALNSMRFIFFFAPIAAFLGSIFLADRFRHAPKAGRTADILFAALCLMAVLGDSRGNVFRTREIFRQGLFPAAAAAFMAAEDLPPQVFNYVRFGGYLERQLWPKYRFFIDGRMLVNRTMDEYYNIMGFTEKGVAALQKRGISTIITPAVSELTGEIVPLVRGLYKDPEWSLAYNDGQALIFTRKGMFSKELPKYKVYSEVISEVKLWGPSRKWTAGFDQSLAEARAEMLKTMPAQYGQ